MHIVEPLGAAGDMLGSERVCVALTCRDSAVVRQIVLLLIVLLYIAGLIVHYVNYPEGDVEAYMNVTRQQLDKLKLENRILDEMLKQTEEDVNRMAQVQEQELQNLFARAELIMHDLEMFRDGVGEKLSWDRVQGELTRRLLGTLSPLSYGHETSRRKLERLIKELWLYIMAQEENLEEPKRKDAKNAGLTSYETQIRVGNKTVDEVVTVTPGLDANSPAVEKPLKKTLQGYRRSINDALEELEMADGAGEDRLRMSLELGDLVKRRLHALQNPKNCSLARFLHCSVKSCGYGCIIHHHVQCLIMAYATERVMVPLSDEHYNIRTPEGGEFFLLPLTTSCLNETHRFASDEGTSLGKLKSDIRHLNYAIIDMASADQITVLPLAVPADLAPKLALFHGNPPAWWVGQMAAYILRFTPTFEAHLRERKEMMGFTGPIVGVHVRRTDKLYVEAAFHDLREYMNHVRDYYDQLERTRPDVKRRVYLASDEQVFDEARKRFPDYTFLVNEQISKDRETVDGLAGLVEDVHFLSRCDFLVCTFSSQVCRLAYELMQTLHGDASQRFRSLDDIYYFGGQGRHLVRVVEPDDGNATVNGERLLRLVRGELVHTAGNHWNGLSKGSPIAGRISGFYPSYKTEEVLETACLPEYPDVPLKRGAKSKGSF
ncbi:unnamed protein product [Lymnaea stagnalis]|uniref:GT23 domain-containing protein n=1 Tax=Lymnaea stagnalis TaxID=6523 RepID=A0AAV2HSN4_LYMST